MNEHPIHPWYGPCDEIANGHCAECIRIFEYLDQQNRKLIKATKYCMKQNQSIAKILHRIINHVGGLDE